MKNYSKHNQTQIETATSNNVEATVRTVAEVVLFVEELEQVIAPGMGVKR